mmetsp:Transcript_31554/g.51050  ORF Transcript_31554/g.51050 Transcript_31554/m.51050 type:complete len:118 (+) Transcript_31554:1062-1415(+)
MYVVYSRMLLHVHVSLLLSPLPRYYYFSLFFASQAVLAVGYVHQLDEKVKTWNYDDSFKRAGKHCDVSAPKYLRQVACYSLQDASNSAAEEDLRWILARLNETCDGVTSEDQCTLDD